MIISTPIPEDAKKIELSVHVGRWTAPHETQLICYLSRLQEGNIVEIGTCNGLTTRELALHNASKTVYSYDYIEADDTMHPSQKYEKPIHEFGKWAKGISNALMFNQNSRTLDYSKLDNVRFIFIDGDHSYAGVKADTELALAHLKNVGGGVIVWHDYYSGSPDWCRVYQYINEEIAPTYPVLAFEGTWVAMLRI